MFGLQMLDVIIGLVFIYVLLALVCTVLMEMIAGFCDSRTKNLRLGIKNLLGESQAITMLQHARRLVRGDSDRGAGQPPSLVDEFYNHPLIKTLHEDGTPPSYIPPATFALTVIDMFAPAQGTGVRTVDDFTAGVTSRLENYPDLQRNLLIIIDESEADMAKLKMNIEVLFNNAMERVAGWYKNKTQVPLIISATLLCLVANADTIRIAKSLSHDEPLRSALVAQAQEYAKKAQPTTGGPDQDATVKLDQTIGEIRKLGLGFGWDNVEWQAVKEDWRNTEKWPKEWPFRLIGIIITALAVSLGAPFWFDILNRLVNIRAVGKSPAEKKSATTVVQT